MAELKAESRKLKAKYCKKPQMTQMTQLPWVSTHDKNPTTTTWFCMIFYASVGSANAHPRLESDYR